jgi:hypothetical protein
MSVGKHVACDDATRDSVHISALHVRTWEHVLVLQETESERGTTSEQEREVWASGALVKKSTARSAARNVDVRPLDKLSSASLSPSSHGFVLLFIRSRAKSLVVTRAAERNGSSLPGCQEMEY